MLGIGQASHIAQKGKQDIVNADLKAWFKFGRIGIGSVCILRLKNRTEQVAKKPCGSFVGKLLTEKEQHIAVLFLVSNPVVIGEVQHMVSVGICLKMFECNDVFHVIFSLRALSFTR